MWSRGQETGAPSVSGQLSGMLVSSLVQPEHESMLVCIVDPKDFEGKSQVQRLALKTDRTSVGLT